MKRRPNKKRLSPDICTLVENDENNEINENNKKLGDQISPTRGRKISTSADTKGKKYEPEDWDESQPYGGKIFLTRVKKSESILVMILQGIILTLTVLAALYVYYYAEHAAVNIEHIYAHFGHSEAQHKLAQRYLHGKGVDKDKQTAVQWLHKAAAKGHPEASYNLAVAHIKGYSKLEPGKARKLFEHAAANGVEQAKYIIEDRVCDRQNCE